MARRLSGRLAMNSIPRLTLFGRSLLLLTAELLANAVAWIVCALLFGRRAATRPILSLAVLAWTIGLRHALDADHISAIDNATRSLINLGQLPVTCGLFFSLGHSTIVIVVNVAIAISTDVYDHIQGVGEVGGIVGAAVSASFLFIVGLANTIILIRVLRKRRQLKKRRAQEAANNEAGPAATKTDDPDGSDDIDPDEDAKSQGNTLMMKILGPVVTFVDRPWKMYPVGVLFGFGFDTASSIALLAISAIAKRDPDGQQINPADIVILPILFTAGMTLIDSLDSIIMLYSYAGFPERGFAIFERRAQPSEQEDDSPPSAPEAEVENLPHAGSSTVAYQRSDHSSTKSTKSIVEEGLPTVSAGISPKAKVPAMTTTGVLDVNVNVDVHPNPPQPKSTDRLDEPLRRTTLRVKANAMSDLSVLLTAMSILVAFAISLITTMGLIGDNCRPCQAAAEAEDGGGLAGRWWRGWANANDNSGFIGAAIVGSFILVVSGWYGIGYLYRKRATPKTTSG